MLSFCPKTSVARLSSFGGAAVVEQLFETFDRLRKERVW
jgi:hypothetical protein